MQPTRSLTGLLSFLLALSAQAQFTSGHLAVLQVGDGSSAIGGAGAPVFIRDFSIASTSFGFQVALPTNGPNALILANNNFTGSLALSADETSLLVAGYNTPLPYTISASIDTSTNINVPRAVASVNYAGTYALHATSGNAFNRGTVRGGVSDGKGNFWAGGAADGIQYLGLSSTQAMAGTAGAGAIRDILMINGAIYYSSSQFPASPTSGIVMFTNRAPTAASPTAERLIINTTSIPGGLGNANPKGFAIDKALTNAYVVDMRTTANGGGIYRFRGDGQFGSANWQYSYTIASTVGAIQDIAVDFSRPNPVIYAIAGTAAANTIVSVADQGPGSAFTILTTAPALTTFRGIAFAPVEPTRLSIRSIDDELEISWNGGGTLQSAAFVTGPWTDITDITSPYSVAPSEAAMFFRVVR
jgi:hypothetical protein